MPLTIQKNNKLIDTPIGFTCDCCKYYVPFSKFRADGINAMVSDPEFIAINHQFGYGSSVDGKKVQLTICEPCFEGFCQSHALLEISDEEQQERLVRKESLEKWIDEFNLQDGLIEK